MRSSYDYKLRSVASKVRALGVDYNWANMFVKKLRDDEIVSLVPDESQRKWAQNKEWLDNITLKYILWHPDTAEMLRISGLPNWEYAKEQILSICQHVSSFDYLGPVIIITGSGMKLCETNSHTAIDYDQIMCGPTLTRSQVKYFFKHQELRDFDERVFQAYKESQE